ncbi:glycosyltransferase family 2 protein [Sphingobium boeckii]|uniref:Dolichol-phosphate mannosyltransferase n=1 Tax=Sphingobium boeckii TaxID=1082345 RepID=A0A7W9AIP6_9SPHN|nr:glycosyltransferase family 2 protein [Sphingobium boeckii]MBB5686176.1 dolichol-phosphate mannosyltransferase [Sphingobium boeckii]
MSIVIPTYNEKQNIRVMLAAVEQALPATRWELVFVDDNSPDGTADEVRRLAQSDPRVRVVHRYGRRGLSSACVEGVMATASPYIAIMDADMQHDEAILGQMLHRLKTEDVDIVVGSRYVEGGGFGEWSKTRLWMSKLATAMATRLTRTPIGDPMSGFMMFDRAAFMRSLPQLSSVGFKILLDIAASAPVPLKVAEVPYVFRNRQFGESKLDSLVLWEYFQLLLDKMFGRYIPVRFLSFVLVGGFGVFVHFAVLTAMFKGFDTSFSEAQTVATIIAISNNFFLNNLLTYRDQRLRGRSMVMGWVTFNLVCATGAAANVGVADWLFTHKSYWVLSALAGISVSVVWNYVMSSFFTWRRKS